MEFINENMQVRQTKTRLWVEAQGPSLYVANSIFAQQTSTLDSAALTLSRDTLAALSLISRGAAAAGTHTSASTRLMSLWTQGRAQLTLAINPWYFSSVSWR